MSGSRRQQGFTLVELAISILVLAVGLTAVLSVASYTIREAREIIQDEGALNAALTVLDSPAWPADEELPINGYKALLTITNEDRPLAADGSTNVTMKRRNVTLTMNGKHVLSISKLAAP